MHSVRSLSNRRPAFLLLQDGTVFEGYGMGKPGKTIGEVVFNTGMSGYQEVLTDPSYRGQVVTFTCPHIGNYGVNLDDNESNSIHALGAVVRSLTRRPSNQRSQLDFESWLIREGIVGICEVDTRALTRHLRDCGVSMGMIIHDVSPSNLPEYLKELRDYPEYESFDHVGAVARSEGCLVTPSEEGVWQGDLQFTPMEGDEVIDVAVLDFGVKHNILRYLLERGLTVALLPKESTKKDLQALKPRGVLFSNGPGDPGKLKSFLPEIRSISESFPTMGICLGHQLIASAFGGETFKLRYGHRGPNQPVRDEITGKVRITSQNHGFSVQSSNFPEELEIRELNLNDETVAAFRHRELPLFAVQYHPEAGPGPADGVGLFEEFEGILSR